MSRFLPFRDEKPSKTGKIRCGGPARLTEALPPAFDGGGGEFGGVVVDPDAHPTFVGGQILDTVGDGLAQLFIHEVVDANLFGVAGGSATRGPRF